MVGLANVVDGPSSFLTIIGQFLLFQMDFFFRFSAIPPLTVLFGTLLLLVALVELFLRDGTRCLAITVAFLYVHSERPFKAAWH